MKKETYDDVYKRLNKMCLIYLKTPSKNATISKYLLTLDNYRDLIHDYILRLMEYHKSKLAGTTTRTSPVNDKLLYELTLWETTGGNEYFYRKHLYKSFRNFVIQLRNKKYSRVNATKNRPEELVNITYQFTAPDTAIVERQELSNLLKLVYDTATEPYECDLIKWKLGMLTGEEYMLKYSIHKNTLTLRWNSFKKKFTKAGN
jgi:hypothetical protein